jgi:hypothetical protein
MFKLTIGATKLQNMDYQPMTSSDNYSHLSQNPLWNQAIRAAIKERLELEKGDACLMATRAGLTPDRWQSDLLRSDAKQMILNCSRQSGKSTISAVLAVHEAIYAPGSLTLLLAPSLRQSTELFRKVKDIFVALQSPYTPQIIEESNLRLELNNDSRIISLPGTEQTVRGFSSVGLLVVDEAAVCDDALFYAIKPMLAISNGRIILLSTPRGRRGFFYDVWEGGADDWHRTRITAQECPRISPEWLENEKRTMPAFWFKQELECEFTETLDSVFSFDDIEAAISSDITPLFPKEQSSL